MKLTKIGGGLSKMSGRTGLVLQKASPEILLGVGITGLIGAGVMASFATLKVEGVKEKKNDKVETIHEVWEQVESGERDISEYTEKDKNRDLTVAYVQTAVDYIKLYGPAVTLAGASIFCILTSHGIMKKRNVALIAAYKAVEEGFNAYRKRVVEEFGEDKDYMFKHGLTSEKVVETVTDEDGKKKKVTSTKMAGPGMPSVYAKIFDETSREWAKDAEMNLFYIHSQQNYFNQLLQTRGHVFLNEVYDALGFDRSTAGAVVGWVLGGGGNDYIDFGLYDQNSKRANDFVNGLERSIILDFNVDGVIHDLI